MLGKGNGVQVWVRPETRDAFKQIGQATGESQAQLTARLAREEQQRLQRRQQRRGGVK